MHYAIRLMVAGVISSIAGWLLVSIGNGLYAVVVGQPPAVSSDFVIVNWTVSLVLSGVVFMWVYLKVTAWWGE